MGFPAPFQGASLWGGVTRGGNRWGRSCPWLISWVPKGPIQPQTSPGGCLPRKDRRPLAGRPTFWPQRAQREIPFARVQARMGDGAAGRRALPTSARGPGQPSQGAGGHRPPPQPEPLEALACAKFNVNFTTQYIQPQRITLNQFKVLTMRNLRKTKESRVNAAIQFEFLTVRNLKKGKTVCHV